jgi:hypothetical protein
MSNGIIGLLFNGALWRSALTGFRALSRDGNLDPSVPNLPLETPADGLVRGLCSAAGSGTAAAVGTLGAPIPAAAFVSRAQLRARKKIRRGKATGNATANAVAAGYFLSSARAEAAGTSQSDVRAVPIFWGRGEAAGSGAAEAIGTTVTPMARPSAQGWIIF